MKTVNEASGASQALTTGVDSPSNASALALFRQATDIANVCKEIVLACTKKIGDKEYVEVEGWMSIAVVHACILSIKEGSVREVYSEGNLIGTQAVAQVVRQSDQAVLSTAEGFVGVDEELWYGSHGKTVERWSKALNKVIHVVVEKRPDYAIRAMAQTRALSRVGRTGFAHVVVLMRAGLSTTPYEEVAGAGEGEEWKPGEEKKEKEAAEAAGDKREKALDPSSRGGNPGVAKQPAGSVPRDPEVGLKEKYRGNQWEAIVLHFSKNKGKTLGELTDAQLRWYIEEWQPRPYGNPPTIGQADIELRAALDAAADDLLDRRNPAS